MFPFSTSTRSYTVNEEFSESGFSITPSSTANLHTNQLSNQLNSQLTNQTLIPAGKQIAENGTVGQSKPSSTSLGTTLSNGANEISDEEIGLIRRRSTGSSKKKSGILRTLFRFGSKKFKDKAKQPANAKLSTPQHIKKELEEEVEKIRARKAALYEQEIIQEYYKRLIDQQKFQQLVNQQAQQRQQIVNNSANSSTNNTLKRQPLHQQQSIHQSIQQQIKKQQDPNLKCLPYMTNSDQQSSYLNSLPSSHLQTNRLQSNLVNSNLVNSNLNSNHTIMNKPMNSFETTNSYLPGYGSYGQNSIPNSLPSSLPISIPNSVSSNHIQSRGLEIDAQRPKSSYLPYDNSMLNPNCLINQSDFYSYYNELGRKVIALGFPKVLKYFY